MVSLSWRFCLLVGFAGLPVIACQETTSSAPPNARICVEQQTLSASKYRGTSLPAKTIALTFDDGPGIRTIELSHYLKSKNVPAAFFVNGKNLGANGGALLQALVDDGHVIGNHTQDHIDLTTCSGAQVVTEVAETDALIAPFVPDGRFMFRPPFGAYNDTTFSTLEASAMKKYVGPIDWDIGSAWGPNRAADWDCWSAKGTSDPAVVDMKTCGDRYLAEIRSVGQGIVLLHDPYFINDDPTKEGTVDMVKYIVPILQAEGFTFARVDMVPSIAQDLPPLTQPTPASQPPQDGGAATPDASGASGGGAAAGSSGVGNTQTNAASSDHGSSAGASGGDSSEPCPASPQREQAWKHEESGNLRNP